MRCFFGRCQRIDYRTTTGSLEDLSAVFCGTGQAVEPIHSRELSSAILSDESQPCPGIVRCSGDVPKRQSHPLFEFWEDLDLPGAFPKPNSLHHLGNVGHANFSSGEEPEVSPAGRCLAHQHCVGRHAQNCEGTPHQSAASLEIVAIAPEVDIDPDPPGRPPRVRRDPAGCDAWCHVGREVSQYLCRRQPAPWCRPRPGIIRFRLRGCVERLSGAENLEE